MTIREHAQSVGCDVVGKLTRFSKGKTFDNKGHQQQAYIDEAKNEYYCSKGSICIVTADGSII